MSMYAQIKLILWYLSHSSALEDRSFHLSLTSQYIITIDPLISHILSCALFYNGNTLTNNTNDP